jgi:PAS domain-containing protein
VAGPALTSRRLPGNVTGVPHLELSVSEPHVTRARQQAESPLTRWAAAVSAAGELCLILDTEAVIVAISAPFERLLGLDRPAVGRDLLDGVLHLLDFADGGALTDGEVTKIPPLLALTSGRLARGLVRIQATEEACTLDAIATPMLDGEATAGSLTFFSRV